jgi:hypothetical protein
MKQKAKPPLAKGVRRKRLCRGRPFEQAAYILGQNKTSRQLNGGRSGYP